MYVKPGQTRPNAPQDVVLARYEQCEDMACVLTEHAQTLAFKENFTESEVLVRCHQGLLVALRPYTATDWRPNAASRSSGFCGFGRVRF